MTTLAARYERGGENAGMADYLGADSVTFLSVEGLRAVAGPVPARRAGGDYTSPSPTQEAGIRSDRRG